MDATTSNAPSHSPHITVVTDDTFATEVKAHPGFVLVDMWADWCTPCHMLAPHLDKIADRLPGKLKIVKLDVDNNQRTGIEYNVMSLPTLLLMKGGEIVGQAVGFRPEPVLLQWLAEKGVDITPVAAATPVAPATPTPAAPAPATPTMPLAA